MTIHDISSLTPGLSTNRRIASPHPALPDTLHTAHLATAGLCRGQLLALLRQTLVARHKCHELFGYGVSTFFDSGPETMVTYEHKGGAHF